MIRAFIRVALLSAVALCGCKHDPAATEAKDPKEAAQKDIQAAQGPWVVVSVAYEGGPPERGGSGQITIKDDQILMHDRDGRYPASMPYGYRELPPATFELDASKSPKRVAIKGWNGDPRPRYGIYELSGDSLTIAMVHQNFRAGIPLKLEADPDVDIYIFRRGQASAFPPDSR